MTSHHLLLPGVLALCCMPGFVKVPNWYLIFHDNPNEMIEENQLSIWTGCKKIASIPCHPIFQWIFMLKCHSRCPDLSVLDISNTFLWPFPRIAAFDTNGSLSVEVFPRNSGRIWARIAAWHSLAVGHRILADTGSFDHLSLDKSASFPPLSLSKVWMSST